jgi:hypothetical protein
MRYILMAIMLSGCAGQAEHEKDTGTLRCIGYCDLSIDRSESVIQAEADGSYYEHSGTGGLGKIGKVKEKKKEKE